MSGPGERAVAVAAELRCPVGMWWTDSWAVLARPAVVGTAAYVTVLVILRVVGKRSLAKLNAFDFVITVALGSTLATIFLSKEVSWAEGAVALTLLAGLQLAVTWLSSHVPGARDLVTSRPSVVFRDGRPLPDVVRAQRLTTAELRQAVRSTGRGNMSSVAAIMLKTDGTRSVIPAEQYGDGSALEELEREP